MRILIQEETGKKQPRSGKPRSVIWVTAFSAVFWSMLTAAPLTPSYRSGIQKVPAETLVLPQPTHQRSFGIEVRGVSDADSALLERLRAENRSLVVTGLGISAAAVAEAFLLPGFYSGSLIASAVILVPLTVAVGMHEKRQHDAIEKALMESSLIDFVSRNLTNRVHSGGDPLDRNIAVEIVILAYGLTREPTCLFASAAIKIRAQEQYVYEDIVYIEPFVRSADAPPPICRSMGDFAESDGRLVRNGLIDYGQIISAIVIKRTKDLPWKD